MRAFRTLTVFGLAALALAITVKAAAQEYSPRPGETVMRVAIEGKGNVFIRLFTKEAPKATSHVMNLARKGHYNGQRIFRVERSPRPFLIQMGAPGSRTKSLDDPSLQTEGTGARIPYEDSGYKFDKKGMVGLSTLEGDRDSGDCLFHIALAPVSFLNGSYTVMGQVVGGLGLLDRIEKGDRITVSILGG